MSDDLFFRTTFKAISALSDGKKVLLEPNENFNRENTLKHFYSIYESYAKLEPASRMFRSLAKMFGIRYILLLLIRIYYVIIDFSGPIIMGTILGKTTGALEIETEDKEYCYCLIIVFIVANLIKIIVSHQYVYGLKVFESQIEIIVSDLAYKKILKLKGNVNKLEAKIIRLINDDCWQIANFFHACNYLWELPFNIIFALYVTFLQVSYAFIPGLLFAILLLYVNYRIAISINRTNDDLNQPRLNRKDIELIALKNIKSVKFFSMEKYFLNKILVNIF
jgi:ABC-type bacteriocin/lantibiotic exporter with double-glycine peptidase domain